MVLLSPRRKKDTILSNKPADSWLVLDQTFFSLFKMFSLIELAHIGAGLIDGLIASNFLDVLPAFLQVCLPQECRLSAPEHLGGEIWGHSTVFSVLL